jgi:hypothetical protein
MEVDGASFSLSLFSLSLFFLVSVVVSAASPSLSCLCQPFTFLSFHGSSSHHLLSTAVYGSFPPRLEKNDGPLSQLTSRLLAPFVGIYPSTRIETLSVAVLDPRTVITATRYWLIGSWHGWAWG